MKDHALQKRKGETKLFNASLLSVGNSDRGECTSSSYKTGLGCAAPKTPKPPLGALARVKEISNRKLAKRR